ncbi:MAG: site-specific DNA-methyltransferase [Ginsengibacter sp.]
MEATSTGVITQLLKELRAFMPEAFCNGKLEVEKLKFLLGSDSVYEEERFELTWPGKSAAYQLANSLSAGTLVSYPKDSINWNATENIFIEGENLDALKILQEDYFGKIKTIYIDPPYNTRNNSFTYGDKFSITSREYLSRNDHRSKKVNTREALVNENNHNGHFHTNWLSMIYPRLILARKLLREDGIIFVSIDDNELANLKIIMDEIFGGDNYIDIFCWAKSETPANLSRKSKKIVEYILCYQKNKTSEKFKGLRKRSISSNGLLNQSNKLNTLVFPSNIVRTNIADQVIEKGMYGTDKYHIELLEKTEVKNGLFVSPVSLKAKFKWTQPKLNMEIGKGTTISIPTMRFSPSYERPEYDAEVPANLINSKVGVATNETAGKDLQLLFGAKVFDFPKPPSLIKYLLGFSDDPEGIILDFFAGSGSTAQAVLEMNAKDNGNRKFICVQQNEKTPALSIAREYGFDNISQITKKRIELVIEKQISSLTYNMPGQPGFRYYKIVTPGLEIQET